MELKKAESLVDSVSTLRELKKDLERVNNTKEFITISFKGEDGNETKHNVSFGHEANSNDKFGYSIAKACHEKAVKIIENEIEKTKRFIEGIK